MRGEFFNGNEGGPEWVRGLFVLLVVIALVVGTIFVVRMLLANRPLTIGRHTPPPPALYSPALAELDLRYARGEITREEYLQRRADLAAHLGGPPPMAPPGPGVPPSA
ncbi:MAG TPA: SHOCT domain-containing protein [Candidatus Dormibacteraeota bacterium]|jgi:putative membrane protein|nr:SHOCT domain-containing protein [Candidatus Dormibacteraeota bacterium]